MSILSGYLASLAAFLVLDLMWLAYMAGRFYRPIMGDIAMATANLAPAAVFYLIYPLGLMYFAVAPALRSGGLSAAMFSGALLGAIAYATYDLTNQATLRNWSVQLTVVDIAWGTLLSALAAGAGYLVAARFAA